MKKVLMSIDKHKSPLHASPVPRAHYINQYFYISSPEAHLNEKATFVPLSIARCKMDQIAICPCALEWKRIVAPRQAHLSISEQNIFLLYE
jgi:hypothetical protein